MGYTIRDYIYDEINKDLRELGLEYNVRIEIGDDLFKNEYGDYETRPSFNVYKDELILSIEINLDTKLSHIKDELIDLIEKELIQCVSCGKWFIECDNDEVDLDLTDDEYYHSLECLEKHDNQLWDRYCKKLGD